LGGRRRTNGVLRRFVTQLWGNKIYYEDDLRKLLNISVNEQCSDLYCHTLRCKHLLVEKKGTDIRKVENSLTKTLNRLRDKGYKVDELVLIVKSMRKMYGLKRDKEKYLVIVNTGDRYKIKGLLVRCFTEEEINRRLVRRYYLGGG